MKNKRYFPMFIDLSDKKIVVVGGGNIATRRIRTLLQFTRNITAIAPKSTMELQELGKTGYVNLITRPVIGITASGLDHSRAKKVRLAIQEAMEASDDTDNSEE